MQNDMSHRTIQGMHIFGFTIQFNRYLAFLNELKYYFGRLL